MISNNVARKARVGTQECNKNHQIEFQVSSSLNSLAGVYMGIRLRHIVGVIDGDSRSFDCNSSKGLTIMREFRILSLMFSYRQVTGFAKP